MVSAINLFGSNYDPEHYKILQELMKLGISPSGNPSIDKSKLQQAKNELIEKIQAKQEQSSDNEFSAQVIAPVDFTQDPQRADMELQRLGAMTVAELNRLYFGI